jgi:hypothetical protein
VNYYNVRSIITDYPTTLTIVAIYLIAAAVWLFA